MPSLEEYVRGLDAETLAQLKRDLPLRIKSLAPETQKAVMERLGNFYQFQDLPTPVASQKSYQEPVQPPQTDIPLWQKGLNALSWPFQQAEEKIIKPFWSAALSPITPSMPGTEGMPWLERERAEYEAWKAPQVDLGFNYPLGMGRATLGVKGALEMAPWLLSPGLGAVGKAGKVAGVAGKAATTAQLLKRGTLVGGKLASGDPWGLAGALGQAGPKARVAGRIVENLPWALGERGAIAGTQAVGKGLRAIARGPLADQTGAIKIPGKEPGKAKLTDAELLEQAAKEAAPPVTKGAEAIPPTGEAVPGKAAAPAPTRVPGVQGVQRPSEAAAAAVTPTATAVEGVAGGRPPRKPLWAGFEEPPQKPPEGPTPTPTAFPSGRVPGGIGRQTPYVAPDSYAQLQEALAVKKQPLGDKVSVGLNKVLPEMYDRNYLLKEIEKTTGIPVHKAAQAVSGAVAAAEDNIRRSIRPILRSVGADTPLLEEYLVLQRLTDVTAKHPTALLPRNMRGMEAVIEAQKKLAAKLGPERFAAIEAAAKQYWKETSELTLELLRKEGMIDDGEYLRLKTSSPHYIPLNRADFSEIDDIVRYMGVQEASVSTTGMKRMGDLGSVRDLDNPLARGIQQVIRVRQAVARKQTATMLLQGLQEYEKLTGQKMVRFLDPGRKAEHSVLTDTISTFIEGKKVIAQVPREYAVIAKGLEAEVAGMWGKLLSVTAAPLRYGATTYNPAFLVVNPMRDALTAFFREGVIPFSPDYIKGWISAIYKDATFTEAAQAGELMSGLVERMRSTSAVARQASVGSLPLKNWKDALLFVPRLIEWGNVTGERATRLAAHVKLTREGVTGLERTVRVRDSTVDFSKMGNAMKVINQAIPFFNAGIQGAANVGRTIRDKPGWALKASTPFAAISIMMWLNNKRFDSSDKIPSWEYYNNWVLQVGEGREKTDPGDPYKEPETFPIYLKIPKGPIGASLTAAPELLLRLAWGMNNRSVIDEVLAGAQGFTSSLLPIEPNLGGILPPALSTAVQLQTGQDIYRGLPIVPEREKRLPPEQQFGADVSTAAVQLGQTFKVSPRLIDFAIKDYAAGTGSTLTWLSSMALEALGAKPEPYGAAFITERSSEQGLAKTPIVSRFVGVRGNAMETAQYKELTKLVKDAQQTFRKFPDVNRLGITFSEVGDTIMDVPLELPERIEYQRLTNQLALTGLAALFDSTGYQSLSPVQKKELILKTMSLARDAARQSLVPKLNEMVQIRYELGQHGASLSKLEELSGEKWNSPANLETLKDALSVLRLYWNLEATVWGQYPPEYKQVYDQWRTINKIDAREAKRFLFKYPQVAMAIRRVALAKKQMLLQLEPKLSTARELLFS